MNRLHINFSINQRQCCGGDLTFSFEGMRRLRETFAKPALAKRAKCAQLAYAAAFGAFGGLGSLFQFFRFCLLRTGPRVYLMRRIAFLPDCGRGRRLELEMVRRATRE